jgi:hypothetical protein
MIRQWIDDVTPLYPGLLVLNEYRGAELIVAVTDDTVTFFDGTLFICDRPVFLLSADVVITQEGILPETMPIDG